MNEMVNKCYSCDFHRQECTFTLSAAARPNTADPQSKKRKLEDSVPEDAESVKRYVIDFGSIVCSWRHAKGLAFADHRQLLQNNKAKAII